MAAENSNKSQLKTNTTTRKNTFTLVIEKFRDVCITGGMRYTPSHTNVSKFVNFQLTFFNLHFSTYIFNFAVSLK